MDDWRPNRLDIVPNARLLAPSNTMWKDNAVLARRPGPDAPDNRLLGLLSFKDYQRLLPHPSCPRGPNLHDRIFDVQAALAGGIQATSSLRIIGLRETRARMRVRVFLPLLLRLASTSTTASE